MSWDFCRHFWRFLPPFFAAFAPRDPPREVHQGSPKRDPIIPHCPPSLSQKGAQNWYPSDGDRDVLAMEVGLQFTKGRKRNFKRCAAHTHRPNIIANIRRKIFCLYEVDDFIFDPVVCMIAIGILDNAFELGFTRAEDIFKLRVDRRRQTMCLRWKASWRNKPVFRQAVPTSDGVQTSKMSLSATIHSFTTYSDSVWWRG